MSYQCVGLDGSGLCYRTRGETAANMTSVRDLRRRNHIACVRDWAFESGERLVVRLLVQAIRLGSAKNANFFYSVHAVNVKRRRPSVDQSELYNVLLDNMKIGRQQ
jgi:hypothetical protein